MDFIQTNIIDKLRHSKPLSLDENFIRYALWYSTTDQAYAQRTDIFDNSWLSSSTSDIYVALGLMKILKLESVNFYDTELACHDSVNQIKNQGGFQSRLDVYRGRDRKSLFYAYNERIRNGIAHGTFNEDENRFFIINQRRPKPEEKVNFYMCLSEGEIHSLITAREFFEGTLNNVLESKYWCLEEALQLKNKDGKYYSRLKKCFVVIDDSFRFDSNKRVDEIHDYLSKKYKDNTNTVVIVSENLGNISDKHLTSENQTVRMIQQNKIADFFEIKNVKLM